MAEKRDLTLDINTLKRYTARKPKGSFIITKRFSGTKLQIGEAQDLEEVKMKKLSRILALLMALVLVFALTACSGGKDDTYVVGICQLVQHDALDAATQGFMDALKEELGDKVVFDNQNASNDIPMCSTIVNQFVSADVDLILANATPALQAAADATVDIPILGTSITEYGVALGLKDFNGTVGGNVSGTSDLAPLDAQAAMLAEWFPDAENVGLLYCSAEANSQYQVDVVKAELEKLGYTCALYSFSDSNDLAAVVEGAVAASDVIYVPTDNTVASNTEIIDNICRPAGIPVIAGEEGICAGCGVATLSISYYDLGYATGKMAVRILKGEAKAGEMPVEYAPATPKYNAEICDELGLTPPSSDYVAIGG